MAVPFLSSISLNKNEVQDFKVFNYAGDVTPLTGTDIGYFWTNTTGGKTLRWWDGSAVRTILDSSSTTIVAADLSGGAAGSLPYQVGAGDTDFLGIGTAGQVLSVSSGVPAWVNQSSLSVGSATTATTATTADKVANALTAGTYLTAGGTFDGSTARTFAVDATSANTASKVVARDASGNFSAGVITATNVTGLSSTPANDADAASKGYVDSVAQGLDVKASCLVATTADITLSAPGAVTIDGVYSATDFTAGTTRILVKSQSLSQENGIYIWQGPSSAMTRSVDANTWDELVGAFTFVERGTDNADSGWVCNVNAGGTLGTTAVTWTKFSQAGAYDAGNGMVLSSGKFHFAQDTNYTAGRIPFASGNTTIGFNANLFWDNSNSRLGIGTASPSYSLHVNGETKVNNLLWFTPSSGLMAIGASGTNFQIYNGTGAETRLTVDANGNLGLGVTPATWRTGIKFRAFQYGYTGSVYGIDAIEQANIASNYYQDTSGNELRIQAGFATRYQQASGEHRWSTAGNLSAGVGISFTQAMTLDAAGRLGIGTPTVDGKVHIYGDTYANSQLRIQRNGAVNGTFSIGIAGTNNTLYIQDEVNATARLIIDGSGNLGLGLTPSAWVGYGLPIIELPNYGTIVAAGPNATLGSNWYYSSGFKYKTAAAATYYNQTDGKHVWYSSIDAVPVANGAIDFGTAKMTLDASGNLGLNTSSDPGYGRTTLSVYNSGGGLIKVAGSATTALLYVYQPDNTAVLATKTNHPFVFETNSTERLRLTANGEALFKSNGTASAPTIANADDTNTGLYWPTDADTLALAVGGSDAVYIDADRQVGLGTPTPNAKLHVKSNTGNARYGLFQTATTTGAGYIGFSTNSFANNRSIIGTDNSAGTALWVTGGAPYALSIGTVDSLPIVFATANNERLRIKSTGQLNLVGLNSAPTGAVGDLYYNSTSNTLQYHNNSAFQQISRKYSTALAGTNTSFTVTHNFGTRDVTVQVRKSGSTYDLVYTDVQMTTTDTVTVIFASSVTGSDYTVTVIG